MKMKESVNAILLPHRVCGLTLFNDWLQNYIGIDNAKCFFGVEDYRYVIDDVTFEELEKILSTFQISKDTFRISRKIDVSERLFSDVLLPEFQHYVQAVAESEPELLKPYQKRSELESELVELNNRIKIVQKSVADLDRYREVDDAPLSLRLEDVHSLDKVYSTGVGTLFNSRSDRALNSLCELLSSDGIIRSMTGNYLQ